MLWSLGWFLFKRHHEDPAKMFFFKFCCFFIRLVTTCNMCFSQIVDTFIQRKIIIVKNWLCIGMSVQWTPFFSIPFMICLFLLAVKRIRGAYKVQPFYDAELFEKVCVLFRRPICYLIFRLQPYHISGYC